MKKKLWIVSELFYPEETSTAYILTEIANKLSEKYEVEAICGPAVYEKSKKDHSQIDCKVVISRISYRALDKNKLYGRLYNFCILSLLIFFKIILNVRKNDKVLIVTNPAPLIVLASLARRIKRFHLSILVHDVFPENTIPARIIKNKDSSYYKILRYIFNKGYSAADQLIVLGRDMYEIFTRKVKDKSRIYIIENWADVFNIVPVKRDSNGLVTFQYAGNLGRVQGLIPLLNIVKETSNDDLHFDFFGTGAVEEDMKLFISDNFLSNVLMHGAYSRNQQNEILNNCDIAIITLADQMYGLGVPSKAYNILASGKPILFIGDSNSEIALMVKENNIGFVFEASDHTGLVSFFKSINSESMDMLTEMGQRARKLAEERYSKSYILDKFNQVL